MDTPRAAIVIPTYDRAATLPRALDSALAQTEAAIEIIVIDDGSTDETQRYLAGVTDPRLHVVRTTNGGPGAARNRGLDEARAPIVSFLDSDDRYRPERIAACLAAFDADPEVVCTLAGAVKIDRERTQAASFPNLTLPPTLFEWGVLGGLLNVEGTSIAVRRTAALAAGGFATDLRRKEDSDFLLRLAAHGSLRLLPDVLWEKFWSTDALSGDAQNSGAQLLAFIARHPKLTREYARMGAYMATKELVEDLKAKQWRAFARDVAAFRAHGILPGSPAGWWRNHRVVRRYRRALRAPGALATLTVPPTDWRYGSGGW